MQSHEFNILFLVHHIGLFLHQIDFIPEKSSKTSVPLGKLVPCSWTITDELNFTSILLIISCKPFHEYCLFRLLLHYLHSIISIHLNLCHLMIGLQIFCFCLLGSAVSELYSDCVEILKTYYFLYHSSFNVFHCLFHSCSYHTISLSNMVQVIINNLLFFDYLHIFHNLAGLFNSLSKSKLEPFTYINNLDNFALQPHVKHLRFFKFIFEICTSCKDYSYNITFIIC